MRAGNFTKMAGRRANPREVARIRKMLIELSRIYPVYVNGRPLHEVYSKHVQQNILAYAKT